MANRGLIYGRFNPIDPETNKYKNNTPLSIGRIISNTFAPEYEAATLYADDALAERDDMFKSGALNTTVADDDNAVEAALYGNTTNEASGVIKNVDDVKPEYGYGHIVVQQKKKQRYYKVEFFPRCLAGNITHDANTRGESTEFNTTSIESTVYPIETSINGLAKGVWQQVKTFDDLAAAKTFLDGLLTPAT